MKPSPFSLEDLTGVLGVGSLHILGLFFIFDGLYGFFPLLERYAATTSFVLLFTVPLIVVSYVLGLFSSLIVDMLLTPLYLRLTNRTATLIEVARTTNDFVISQMLEATRHQRLLNGGALAFLVLALGSLLETKNMPSYEPVGYLGALGATIAALACPMLALRIQRQLDQFVVGVLHIPSKPSGTTQKPDAKENV